MILQSFRRLTIDNDAACLEVETIDGMILRAAEPRLSLLDSPGLPRDFRRVTFVPAAGTLVLIAPNDEELVVEVFRGEDQAQRRAGRPVVYLDQNKWVELARASHSPDRLSPQELEAAHTVIDLARSARLILPLSSGHLIETGRCDRDWRQQLGPLMVSLSRGWLMRDPLLVRRTELRAIFAARAGSKHRGGHEVITLDPSQLYAEDLPERRPADLPEELAVLSDTLSSVTSIYAVLLEDEVVHSVAGYEAAASWASSHQDLASELRSNSKARHMSRDLTRARFLTDLGMDLHESVTASGLSPETFADWLTCYAEDDIAAAPYLGRMRDVIHFRLRNADDSWEPNDLIDMLFLPCATAYADIVVSEQKTGDYLRRAQRSRCDGARIVISFSELVDVLSESIGEVGARSTGGM